jgi:protein tyrosine phosphatase (PTP) superfamily phosphohydrolase (DUF442 family)
MSTPLEAVQGAANACQAAPTLVTGGQPTPEQIAALSRAGGAVVLDIRDPMEPRPFDEPETVRANGMEYVNVPVGPGSMDDATMERILEVVRKHEGRPMYFHCGSGNRVGGALLPYFIIDRGMSEEAAIEQAMRIGLRSPELLEWGLEYARRQQRA